MWFVLRLQVNPCSWFSAIRAVAQVHWNRMEILEPVGLQSSLFFESAPEIFARVFRELKPRTALPQLTLEFCKFANADSFIRLENGRLHVRISDLLEGA